MSVFVSELAEGLWLTEHVRQPSTPDHDLRDACGNVGDYGKIGSGKALTSNHEGKNNHTPPREPTALTTRLTWDVSVELAHRQVVARPLELVRLNHETKTGRTAPWRKGEFPEEHVAKIREKLALEHRVSPEAVMVAGVPNAGDVHGRPSQEVRER